MLIPTKRAPGSADSGLRQARLPNNGLSGTSRRATPPTNSNPLTNQPTNSPRSFDGSQSRTDSSRNSLPTQRPAISPNGFKGNSALPPMRGSQGSSALPPTRNNSLPPFRSGTNPPRSTTPGASGFRR